MQLADFAKWKALDMAGDFVRLANAGDLAYADIPAQRASQYKLLAQALSQTNASMQMNGDRVSDANTPADMFKARFKPLMAIMLKLADGLPSEHIRLDLKTNSPVSYTHLDVYKRQLMFSPRSASILSYSISGKMICSFTPML